MTLDGSGRRETGALPVSPTIRAETVADGQTNPRGRRGFGRDGTEPAGRAGARVSAAGGDFAHLQAVGLLPEHLPKLVVAVWPFALQSAVGRMFMHGVGHGGLEIGLDPGNR